MHYHTELKEQFKHLQKRIWDLFEYGQKQEGILNELLRSAYQIAERQGKETNWEAFLNNIKRELLRQAGLPSETTDEQTILSATCTARAYHIQVDANKLCEFCNTVHSSYYDYCPHCGRKLITKQL